MRAALVAVLLCLTSPALATAPVPITAAGPTLFAGDSITATGNYYWPAVAGGLIDQINATWPAPTPAPNYGGSTGVAGVVVGASGVVASSTGVQKTLQFSDSAVSGYRTSDIVADIPGLITNRAPKTVILLIGINDILQTVNPATTQANFTTIINTVHGTLPTCQIVLLSVLAHNEKWDNVTGWTPGPNVDDAAIASLNTFIAGLAAANPSFVTYVDVRSQLLAYEQANNASPVVGSVVGANSGVATDATAPAGIHPLAPLKLLMGTTVKAALSITP